MAVCVFVQATVHLACTPMRQILIRSLGIVLDHGFGDPQLRFVPICIGKEVDFLVLNRAKEAFHHDIVNPAPAAVHAHLDSTAFNCFGPLFGGILTALIGIEYRRRLACRFKSLHAESRVQRVGQLPRQKTARIPVHDDVQLQEALVYPDVRNVRALDLIGPGIVVRGPR